MMQHMMMTLLFLLVSITTNAQAAKSDRVYFVRGADEPVQIGSKPNSGAGIVMRDPNLGAKDGKKDPAPATVAPAKKKVHVASEIKSKAKGLSFKPMRIAASVRMPRVDFGRVALPVGIREEMPSTDFVGKSLQDLP